MAVIPRSSYYDKNYRQTAALIRARRPYLVKNALTGLGIFGFCAGVYFFTINAVAQDEFEDVKVPDAPAQSPRAGASTMTNGPMMK
jgi:cytochrome c oxidase assembly factor 3